MQFVVHETSRNHEDGVAAELQTCIPEVLGSYFELNAGQYERDLLYFSPVPPDK
jgi:hypothetical protein